MAKIAVAAGTIWVMPGIFQRVEHNSQAVQTMQ
jgi:hypothetical protein